MEILRIHYWFGSTRVLASTLFILLLLVWALFLPVRIRLRSTVRGSDVPAPGGIPQSKPTLTR